MSDMRFRQTDSSRYSHFNYERKTPYDPNLPTSWQGIYSGSKSMGADKMIQDVASKGFHPGQLSLHPVDIRSTGASCNSESRVILKYIGPKIYTSYMDVQITGEIAALSAPKLGDISHPVSVPNSMLDLAIQEAYSAMSKPDVNITENLAEAEQVLGLLKSPVRQFREAWKYLHRRFIKRSIRSDPKRYFDFMSNRWLEARYGIVPIMSDIDGIQSLYQNSILFNQAGLKRAKGGFQVTSDSQVTVKTSWVRDPTLPFKADIWTKTDTRKFVTSGCYFSVIWPESRRLSLNGVNLSQYAYNLWQLVPYSFVLDWVVDVGNWINVMLPDPSINYLGNYVSVVDETTIHRCLSNFTRAPLPQYWTPVVTCSPTYTQTTKRLVRSVNRPVPVAPLLNVEIINLNRSLDALSLIWAQVRRKS